MRRRTIRQARLPIGPPHRNHELFTDHYLNSSDRLKSLPEWQSAQGLEATYEAIKSEYERHAAQFTGDTNESQTEDHFIKPVLGHLGWFYEPQQPIAQCHRTPDYALLLSHEDWKHIQPLKGTPALWQHVAAVGDAKRWELDLDKSREGETPTTQITNYLYRSDARWGILTNGRKWRLYERDRSRGGGVYYEVDLVDLFARGDLDDFKYFYLFFRRDSFIESAGQTFVGRVLLGSAEYATEVGDSVRESVYDALRHLMNGFLSHAPNALDAQDRATLASVHDHSLIVLYRLLFILYAEDVGLLPRDDQRYSRYSLAVQSHRINQALRRAERYLPDAVTIWPSMLNLFKLIDAGHYENGECVIPAYNGGLFNPERFPHIAHTAVGGAQRWDIGDAWLAAAMDTIAYRREKWHEPGVMPVDFATLGVRHLGTIYEGLLELRPVVAEEPMIEQPQEDGKSPVVVPAREVASPRTVHGQEPRRFGAGEVYLATDRGERRATGSYFTPELLVNYTVDHVVAPLADRAARRTLSIKRRLERLGRAQRRFTSRRAQQTIAARMADVKAGWLEPYLSLRVLDPAMGSGHFLVGAADVLSLAMATDPSLPPVPEAAGDSQGYYKRLIANHCLFGVDLNWLAVELAKLSIWLHTVQKGKALDFLDHHLRSGNSLVGATIRGDLLKAPLSVGADGRPVDRENAQLVLGFWDMFSGQALQGFLATTEMIEDAPGATALEQRHKAGWFVAMERERDPYRQVANCWLAPCFGLRVTAEDYQRAVQALQRGQDSSEWRELPAADWFQDAYAMGGNIRAEPDRQDWRSQVEAALAMRDAKPRPRRFFHWELEFPEVFFLPQGWRPEAEIGFDAVIGNPPWGTDSDPATLRKMGSYNVVEEDSCEFFAVKGLELAHPGAVEGYVLPDTVLSPAKRALRQWCLSRHTLLEVLNLGPDWFTADVRMSTVAWRCQRGRAEGVADYAIRTLVLAADARRRAIRGELAVAEAARAGGYSTTAAEVLSDPAVGISLFRNDRDRDVLARIDRRSTRLALVCDRGRGVELNKAGLVMLCPSCLKWDAPPRKREGRFEEKICHYCGHKYRPEEGATTRAIVADTRGRGKSWRPYIDGDAITRYERPETVWIDTSLDGINYKAQELYRDAKILIRQAGVGLNAVLDETGAYCPQSVYVYRVKPYWRDRGYDETLVAALLLSRTFAYIVFKKFGEIDSARAFAKLTHARLENMPVPLLSEAELAGAEVRRVKSNVADLSRHGAEARQDLDWRIERDAARLWGLGRQDVEHMIREFGKVHVNDYLRRLFPEGVEGSEARILEMWWGPK